jgi:hypothetical protein
MHASLSSNDSPGDCAPILAYQGPSEQNQMHEVLVGMCIHRSDPLGSSRDSNSSSATPGLRAYDDNLYQQLGRSYQQRGA